MTSNLYPRGISLHTIGYAALKYPDLPEELPIPLGNQLGVLQRLLPGTQARIMPEIASQYLSTFLAYQTNSSNEHPHLLDDSSSQYWSSDTFALINYLCSNADVAAKVAKHGKLLEDTIQKLLRDDVEKKMMACSRIEGATTYDADFAQLLQFISTILLHAENISKPNNLDSLLPSLLPKVKAWKKKYSGIFIGKVADRLFLQLSKPETMDLESIKEAQRASLICGYPLCSKSGGDLKACGRCGVMRYCGQEHQKKHWGAHKKICEKGLIEVEG